MAKPLDARAAPRLSGGAADGGRRGGAGAGCKLGGGAPRERGRANEAFPPLLADTLELPRRSLSIVSGHGAREKVVLMEGIGPAEVERGADRGPGRAVWRARGGRGSGGGGPRPGAGACDGVLRSFGLCPDARVQSPAGTCWVAGT